jgi:hypothetical protein
MTSQPWDAEEAAVSLRDSQAMLADLADALRAVAPVLEQTRRLGVGAFAWHGIDTDLELASLVYDSALAGSATVRGPGGPAHRTVVFAASDASVQLSLGGDGVVGQLVPPTGGSVALLTAGGEVATAELDELGCFSLPRPPDEAVRLRWRTDAGSFVTEWIHL